MKGSERSCCLPFRCAVRVQGGAAFRVRPLALLAPCRSGCSEYPGEIAFVDALDRQHDDGRGIIRVRRLDARPYRLGKRSPGLDDHDGFLSALDSALPSID